MSIPLPSLDASTFAGQLQWWMAGFGYASCICAIALAVKLFRRAPGPGPFDV